ncbi:MAG: DNA ligase [Alphaproteobacteria bacterium 41-28]|nr:MAG: DNA ligase [Alphaproteobacteria bacterium 41-28]
MKNIKLKSYKKKRDFYITPEPKGQKSPKASSKLRFVIQKHAASHLHYDFRLEMDGVLKSWAIPKGPSLNHEDKRLAIQTEDHPLEYQYFEGIIPAGQYGGGTVLIWDKGTYEHIGDESSLLKDYHKGHLVIELKGKKLKGGFVLQRIKNGDKPQWLFIKIKDKYENKKCDILKKDKSVVTGKTLREIGLKDSHD